ncbi:MAG: sulfatase, partial [Isosphaeraceae bacterium]|nr:sulfatase [Isosphaeraceae bacterium]
VLIVADDLGYAELGCQGATDIRTPNIDTIARDGVRLTNGYVSAPVCSPSRAGLMTGRYQQRFGHEFNAIGAQNRQDGVGLPLSEKTIADRLHAVGYATGLVGKWHLGGTAPYHPQRRGFDEFFGFLHEGHFYVEGQHAPVVSHLRVNEPPYDRDNPILRGTRPVENPGYLTETLTREAIAFLERHADRPFFLYLAYNAVHSPMQARPEDVRRFPAIADEHRRVFAAMLASLDDGVGAVLAKLHDLGLERQTLVVFLSDNGGPTAELTSRNDPLRGGKGQLYDGGIRVPLLLRWPGHLPAGAVYEPPVIALDLLPTFLAAAGVKPTDADRLDGVDLLPYLAGRSDGDRPPHDRLYWRYGGRAALREGRWKLVRDGGRKPWELYDLTRDPGEQHDLAAREPAVVERLQAAWAAWNAPLAPPLWGSGPR